MIFFKFPWHFTHTVTSLHWVYLGGILPDYAFQALPAMGIEGPMPIQAQHKPWPFFVGSIRLFVCCSDSVAIGTSHSAACLNMWRKGWLKCIEITLAFKPFLGSSHQIMHCAGIACSTFAGATEYLFRRHIYVFRWRRFSRSRISPRHQITQRRRLSKTLFPQPNFPPPPNDSPKTLFEDAFPGAEFIPATELPREDAFRWQRQQQQYQQQQQQQQQQ